jgi:hypothetical protein
MANQFGWFIDKQTPPNTDKQTTMINSWQNILANLNQAQTNKPQ